MRGTFRLSRWYLLTGAVATMVGALLYVAGVKRRRARTKFVRSGAMRIAAFTPAGDVVSARCHGTDLQVTYLAKSIRRRSASFDISVTAPAECAGTVTIPADWGTMSCCVSTMLSRFPLPDVQRSHPAGVQPAPRRK